MMIPQHFKRYLSKSDDTDIYVKIIRKSMIEFYKYPHDLSGPRMSEVLQKESKKFRSCRGTLFTDPKTKKYGIDIRASKAAQI